MKVCEGRRSRRAWPRCSGIEFLESRALLSVMALSTSLRLPNPGGSQAGEVNSGAGVQDAGRTTTAETGGSDSANAAGLNNNENVGFQDPSSVDQNGSEGTTRAIESHAQVIAIKESPDLVQGNSASQPIISQSVTKSELLPNSITTPTLVAAGDGSSALKAEDQDVGSGAGLDHPDGVNLVGWATSAPTGGGSSSLDWTGPAIGLTGRTGDAPQVFSPAAMATRLVNSQIPGGESAGHGSIDARTWPQHAHDPSIPVPLGATGTGMGTRAPGWADLRYGSAPLDWEMLDRDLRQFLSRVGGLKAALDGRGGGAEGAFWLEVLTALFVASEAARIRGRWLRRLAPEAGLAGTAPARSPVPPGPWPSGLS